MIQDIAPMQLHLEYEMKQPKETDFVFVFRGNNKREDRALVRMDENGQPWGIDSNLLAGFFCDLDDDDSITIDENELASAGWIEREDLDPMSNLNSLTATMIEAFRTGKA